LSYASNVANEDEQPEVDVILTVSKDSKTITVKFKSPDLPFTVSSFILELETYLHEVSHAADQMSQPGVGKH
jgi:hypothetical protein